MFGHSIDPVPVLYVDLEMTEDDVEERLSDFGFGPESDLHLLCYSQHPGMPALDTPDGGAALAREIIALGVDLVVVDTLSKVIEGEENSADTYLAFATQTGNRLRELGVAGLYLDHTGKDVSKGARGSSAKNDHADAVYRLTRRDRGVVHLELTHRRIGWLESLTLRRTADEHGVRYEIEQEETYPEGTMEVVGVLDGLGAPIDVGSNEAVRLLSNNGYGFRRATVLKAVQHRKREPTREPLDQPESGTTEGPIP
jgi:hypothetical protein